MIFHVNPLLDRIHMKHQVLFSLKDKSKQEGHDGHGSLT